MRHFRTRALALVLNIVLVLGLAFNNVELVHAENTDNGNNNMVVMSEEQSEQNEDATLKNEESTNSTENEVNDAAQSIENSEKLDDNKSKIKKSTSEDDALTETTVVARDITRNVIDTFEIDTAKIENTNPVEVSLTFSAKNGFKIQENDYIQVTWTKQPEEVFFEGFNNTKKLYHNGVYMADLEVKGDKTTITFTRDAEKLNNITGEATFSLKGYNLKKVTQEQWDPAYIYCGDTKKEVEIHTTNAGEPIFFDKIGTMYEEEDMAGLVYWWLNVNEPKFEVTTDCAVKDTIQPGQKYSYLESVKVVKEDGSENIYYPEDDDAFKTAYPNIKYQASGKNIDITIPKEYLNKTYFSFNYVVDITDNIAYFKNTAVAKGSYKNKSGEIIDEDKTVEKEVKNIAFNGGASGTVKGELKIYKNTDDGNKIPIPNVTFLLKNLEGNAIKDGQNEITLTTNEDGIADILNLPVGKYTVKETRRCICDSKKRFNISF